MVLTPSTMLPLGTTAPPFNLIEPSTGKTISQNDVMRSNGLLVAFICNHCPFVVHLEDQLRCLGTDLAKMGIGMVGISASDVKNYPDDAPDKIAQKARSIWSTFNYLFDESQSVSKAYRAACTPDFYLFDKNFKLVYRGQMDNSRPGNRKPVTGEHLRKAAELLVEGRPIPESSMKPSIGCNIKWIKGNEPDYFG